MRPAAEPLVGEPMDKGERGTVRLIVAADALAFLGEDLTPRLEPGLFELFVGTAAHPDSLLKTCIDLLPR